MRLSLTCAAPLAALLAASSAPCCHAIVLRYEPKVGQTATYKAMFAGRMQRAIEGDVPFAAFERYQVTATLTYTSEVLSQTDDATMVKIRMEDGQADVKAGDVAETVDLGTLQAQTTVDRRRLGTDADVTAEADFAEVHPELIDALGSLRILGDLWLGLADVLYLPEGDVGPGATWFHKDVPEGDEPFPILKIDHRLIELTSYKGRKCAKIAVSWRAPFSDIPFPVRGGAVEASASGVLSGEYIVYYDYENCLEVYVEGSVGRSLTVPLPEFSFEQRQQMNVKARLVE